VKATSGAQDTKWAALERIRSHIIRQGLAFIAEFMASFSSMKRLQTSSFFCSGVVVPPGDARGLPSVYII
jgi:hypothetical protein